MTTFYHSAQPSLPTSGGIYRITCTTTSKIYIGSALNLQKRRNEHWYHLSRKTHRNQKLQGAWNKYGEDAFTFEILEFVLIPELLTAREQYWFDKLKPFKRDKGFNISPVAGSRLGVKQPPEAIAKSRVANLGKKISVEHRKKVSLALLGNTHLLGHKHSEETKRKMSKTRLGLPRNEKALAALTTAHIKNMKLFIVTAPDGTEYIVHGLNQFCREHHLDQGAMTRVAQGKCSSHKQWKVCYFETDVS